MDFDENQEQTQEEEHMEDDSDSSIDSDDDAVQNEVIKQLKAKVIENLHVYESHTALISALRKSGELEQLREARESMSKHFPLTPEMWLDWIKDEQRFLDEGSDREMIRQLFERAVKDYTSVDIWLEYIQFAIGDIASENGLQKIRDVAERALTAVGLDVSQGALIFEAYREFENAVFAGLEPPLGSVPSPEMMEKREAQRKRIEQLFLRQLSVPLMGMDTTLAEYKEWTEEEELSTQTRGLYEAVLTKVEQLLPFEEALMEAEGTKLEAFKEYIKYELSAKHKTPARIQCLFERALVLNCLDPNVWIRYGKYLDEELRIPSLILPMYERAVRNCPWSGALWLRYARALERFQSDERAKIVELFETALSQGQVITADEHLQLWLGYLDFTRRGIDWEKGGHEKELEALRTLFQRAIDFMNEVYGNEGDPNCLLPQYWARLEAKRCRNMEKGRELWNGIMQRGFGNQAQMWLEYFNLERAYGDHKHCSKILGRALNSVTDWPECVVDAFITYEREEGTLEQLDQAMERCDAQMRRIEERKAQAEEREAAKHGADQQKKKHGKTGQDRFQQEQTGSNRLPRQQQQHKHQQKPLPKQSYPVQAASDNKPRVVRTDADGFAVPIAPLPSPKQSQLKRTNGVKEAEQSGADTVQSKRSSVSVAPPPGYKGPPSPENSEESTEPPAKKPRVTSDDGSFTFGQKPSQQNTQDSDIHDDSQNSRKVFISNLDFNKKESDLFELLSRAGKVKDIRMVKGQRGRSKGYGYVEYEDEFSAGEALKLDRTELEGRPLYVSKCLGQNEKRGQFKYDNELNKKKLFVRGLPFSTNKEALHALFSQYGTVKDVRLVTYKSGQPKGLAYIEYEKEAEAANAVLKADGLVMGEHQIQVSISNPPKRGAPAEKSNMAGPTPNITHSAVGRTSAASTGKASFTPTLGGGKKDVNRMEKPRTLLAFQPRALKKGSQPAARSLKYESKAASATSKSGDSVRGGQIGEGGQRKGETVEDMEAGKSESETGKSESETGDGESETGLVKDSITKTGLSNDQFRNLLLSGKKG